MTQSKEKKNFSPQEIISKVEKALDIEIEAIQHFRAHLDSRITQAVEAIYHSEGKLIVTGVGKSGDIARKIAHTLSSTGTSAFFLHPTDATHGDSGIISKGDVVLAIGKSGESEELIALIPTLHQIGATVISMTANGESRLAKGSHIVILTPILKEACPLELAPTSSTTIALLLGDAIAMALMEMRNFQAEDFALYHPAGRLGKRLSLRVEDVMRSGNSAARVSEDSGLESILSEITTKNLGACAVVNSEEKLVGFITDFDIRKSLAKGLLKPETKAKDIMNPNPSFFELGEKAYDILVRMENRERPISVAPILGQDRKFLGIVLIHDLLQRGL